MTMQIIQAKLGVGKQRHASVRRAIKKILDETEGRVPLNDLLRILVLITSAVASKAYDTPN